MLQHFAAGGLQAVVAVELLGDMDQRDALPMAAHSRMTRLGFGRSTRIDPVMGTSGLTLYVGTGRML